MPTIVKKPFTMWASTLTSRLGLLALQEIFYDDLDVFHVMFPWIVAFSAIAFRLDGTINGLNAQIEPAWRCG